MSGHSFGAITTQAVGGQSNAPNDQPIADIRIKATIAMSPSMPVGSRKSKPFAMVKIPWLLIKKKGSGAFLRKGPVKKKGSGAFFRERPWLHPIHPYFSFPTKSREFRPITCSTPGIQRPFLVVLSTCY